jgi:hypothetical protein
MQKLGIDHGNVGCHRLSIFAHWQERWTGEYIYMAYISGSGMQSMALLVRD